MNPAPRKAAVPEKGGANAKEETPSRGNEAPHMVALSSADEAYVVAASKVAKNLPNQSRLVLMVKTSERNWQEQLSSHLRAVLLTSNKSFTIEDSEDLGSYLWIMESLPENRNAAARKLDQALGATH